MFTDKYGRRWYRGFGVVTTTEFTPEQKQKILEFNGIKIVECPDIPEGTIAIGSVYTDYEDGVPVEKVSGGIITGIVPT